MASASSRRPPSVGASLAVALLLVLALAVPAALLLVVWSDDRGSAAAMGAPLDYTLSSSARTVTVSATARPTWRDPVVVRAPAWAGLVTEVMVAPGSVVADGTPVLRVDGVEVRYVSLSSPLYREVCQGDTVLVAEVRTVLAGAGLPTSGSARLTARDVASVREFAATIGVVGARTATCFDPSWVLVGAQAPGSLADVAVQVGEPVPAPGEAVLTGEPVLDAVALAGDSGVASLDRMLTPDGVTAFAGADLLVAGRSIGVGVGELGSPEAMAALAEVLPVTGSTAAPSGASTASPSSSVGVAVLLTLTESQFVVPATTVVSPLAEVACIVASGEVVHVAVVASSISGLVVDLGEQPVPTVIDLAPGDVPCG
jgi:hypothetical protein